METQLDPVIIEDFPEYDHNVLIRVVRDGLLPGDDVLLMSLSLVFHYESTSSEVMKLESVRKQEMIYQMAICIAVRLGMLPMVMTLLNSGIGGEEEVTIGYAVKNAIDYEKQEILESLLMSEKITNNHKFDSTKSVPR